VIMSTSKDTTVYLFHSNLELDPATEPHEKPNEFQTIRDNSKPDPDFEAAYKTRASSRVDLAAVEFEVPPVRVL